MNCSRAGSGAPYISRRLRRRACVGRLSRKHLVQHAAEAVDVRPSVEVRVRARLLRAHVGRSPQRQSRLGQPVLTYSVHGTGDPEVGQHRLITLEQDILRFDVPVYDTVGVRVLQSTQHLDRNAASVVEGQLLLSEQTLAEGFPLHVRHGVPKLADCIPGVENWEEVGVLESGGYADFVKETFWSKGSGQFRAEHFERDRSVMAQVVCEVDRGHAAPAEFTLDSVAVSEGGSQGFSDIWQVLSQSLSNSIRLGTTPHG
jgi:hypothetical protein